MTHNLSCLNSILNVCLHSLGGKKNKANKSKPLAASIHSSSDYKPLFLCSPYVNHMLVKGNFKTITELPHYIELDEWLAFNSELIILFCRMLSVW